MENIQINSLSLDELINIHDAKQTDFEGQYKIWNRIHNISLIIRIIAVFFCIGTAAYSYYTAQLEDVSLFLKIIAIIVGAASGVCVMGLFFLLLKPLLYWFRKIAKNKLSNLDNLQRELFLIKKKVMQNCAENHKVSYTKEEYQARKGIKSSKQLSNEWTKNQTTLLEKSIELRTAKLESAQYAEWQWVISAIVVLIVAVTLIVSYILFAVIIVLGILVIAVYSTRKNNDYYYRSYNNTYDDYDAPKKESLFDRIIEKLCGKVWSARDYYDGIISDAKKDIKILKSKNKEILSSLTVWNYPKLDI